MDKIGNKIYELRKQRGLSQEELAYKLGVARQTISKWELGDATPDFKNLMAICEYFGIELEYILSNDENDNSAITKVDSQQETEVLPNLIFALLTPNFSASFAHPNHKVPQNH